MDYDEYLKSEDWKTKREAKVAHNPSCAICGSTENLDVHHLNYRNLIDVEMSDLRRMCRRCHFLAHDLFRQGKIRFRSENHNSRWESIKNAVNVELYGYLGWTKAELAELGVAWPPKKGWKTALESTEEGKRRMDELVARRKQGRKKHESGALF